MTMPRYNDDECERCGGIRAPGSRWCINCLVKANDREREDRRILQEMIDNKDRELAVIREVLAEAIAYGFKQNQERAHLLQYIKELNCRIKEMIQNGKDRVQSNKQKE